ncbi:O-acetyltransferase OatA [Arthrobacter sp. Bi83]|uniref:acyltransferase family protein n=1 Tax=Arthrobacter sp. Bi83 TaxID=2822353 RepID=UPI001D38499E|nr:acyltransferase [Arthrobacter sp. Bi83]CAH0267690.1 O-acetyltransferase OatA [Arthrobacter sp. Bi83]
MNDARIRLDSLTGLRFLAAMLVVLYHASVTLVPEMFPLVSMGQTGVTFFFILSGFVLAWSMKPNTPKRQFYWRRFARVWPLHALTAAAAFVLILATQREQSVPQLIATLLLVQSWHADPSWVYAYNGVSWSLSCEAFFYAVFPFLAVLLSRFRARQLLRICALVFVAAASLLSALLALLPAFDWGSLLYTFPAYRVSEFTVGVCLAIAFRKGWKPKFGVGVGAAAAVGSVLVLEVVAANVPWHIAPALASTLCIPGFALLISAFANRDSTGGRRTLVSSPVMVRLGEWSFALYLVHELVLRTALELGPVTLAERAAFAAVGIAVSIPLSAGLFTLFERPIEAKLRSMFLHRGPVADSREPEESLAAK